MTYTPTTAEVKDAYVRTIRNAFITSTGEHAAEFDRWLETVKHDAWEDGAVNAHLGNPNSRHALGPQEDA